MIRSFRQSIFILSCAILCPIIARAQVPTGAELAEHLDRVRRPTKSFSVGITVSEIRDGKVSRVGEYVVYARKVAGYPDFDTVTICKTPADDRGKVLLTKGNEAWLYDPKSARPVSVSYDKIRNRFFVAYGLTASFVQEYDGENLGEDKALDAARKEHVCWHLKLTHRGKAGLVPESLQYWLDKETLRLVRGQIYSSSGKLLRTAYYTEFKNVLDEIRPTHLPIVSGIEHGLITDVRFNDLAYRETPANVYTREAMPAISKGTLP